MQILILRYSDHFEEPGDRVAAMEIVTILWSIGAAVAITLAVVCGLVWLIERRDLASLMLCILGVATAASAYGELGMMHSATAAEYGEWLRWYYLPVFVALVAMLLFVHYYLGTGRVWLLWTVIFARSVHGRRQFLGSPKLRFLEHRQPALRVAVRRTGIGNRRCRTQ